MELRRLFRRKGVEEQRAITALPWDAGGPNRPYAGTIDQALALVPVFAAVRLLASQIASLPLQTYRRIGDVRMPLDTPSLLRQPSVNGTLYDWLHRCVTSLALRGNAYGYVTARDPGSQYPTMVEWLHPDDVYVQDNLPAGPGSYANPRWYWLGREVPAEDILHIPWFTVPGKVCGLSPIGACMATVSTGLSAQDYTANWFANGAVPPGEFRNSQKTVSQTEADAISARLDAAIRRRKPLVYGNNWEYKPIAVAGFEAKFIETLQLTATNIAAIYGVPPEMIGGQAGGPLTYNTVALNAEALEKFTLRPWLELLEAAFSLLLPRPQYVKFNTAALLRTDLGSRMQAYNTARQIGLQNIDEQRALEDLKPLPNGQGQDYTPLQILLKQAGPQPAEVRTWNMPTREVEVVRRGGYPLTGPEALLELIGRRHDPHDPAALGIGAEPVDPLDEACVALLTALFEIEAAGRAWDPAKHPRNPAGSPGGGKFRSVVDRIKDALDAHLKGDGKGDPFQGFDREQLRKVAKARGIDLKRGESRDSIAEKLIASLKGDAPDKPAAKKAVKKAAKKAAPKSALKGSEALRAAPLQLGETDFVRGVDGDLAQELDPEPLNYYRGDGYMQLNPYLREVGAGKNPDGEGGPYGDLGTLATSMDQAFTHSKLTEPVEVHRGVSGLNKVLPGVDTSRSLVGFEWIEDSYASTSVDPRVAEGFGGGFDTMMRITVPAGVGGIQLSEFYDGVIKDGLPAGGEAEAFYEAELLLERGLRFRIVGDRMDESGVRQLDVEVIPGVR